MSSEKQLQVETNELPARVCILSFIELLLFMTDFLNSYRSNRVMSRCHRLEQDKA